MSENSRNPRPEGGGAAARRRGGLHVAHREVPSLLIVARFGAASSIFGLWRVAVSLVSLPQFEPHARSTRRVKYVRSLDHISDIPAEDRARLELVSQRYAFRANDYYLRLIN